MPAFHPRFTNLSLARAVLVLSLFVGTAPAHNAMAGVSFADSGPTMLDTVNPLLELDPLPDNLILRGGEHQLFHWTSFDDNPSQEPSSYQAMVIVEGEADSTLSWYPYIEEFTWDWKVPEIQPARGYLEVSVSDLLGNTTSAVSSEFTILYSTTNTPDLPGRLSLSSPVPNPFNPSCRLEFNLPWTGQTSFAVHDVRGRRVRLLDSGVKQAGIHTLRWDGQNDRGHPQPGGLYFFVLQVQTPQGQERLTRRAVLIP